MIDPLAHLLIIIASWPLHAVVKRPVSAWILPCAGFLFLLTYAPVAAAWIAVTAAEATVIYILGLRLNRRSPIRKYLPYIILPNFLFVDFHHLLFLISVETLAISFSTIRIFMTVKQLLASRREETPIQASWIFAAGFFLPALIVGPVFSGTALRRDYREPGSVVHELADFSQALKGIVLATFANPTIGMMILILLDKTGFPNWVFAPFYFAQLFVAFWGQSLIAEHTSRFFGYRLPQNFDRPWLARDIREFWSRWHRSMAQFIMQYIFLPLNISGVSPQVATIAAFVFMGLWHNLSLGYLIWGIAHGILTAYLPRTQPRPFMSTLNRGATIAIVITLSYIANFSAVA